MDKGQYWYIDGKSPAKTICLRCTVTFINSKWVWVKNKGQTVEAYRTILFGKHMLQPLKLYSYDNEKQKLQVICPLYALQYEVNLTRVAYAVQCPSSDVMDILWRLINCCFFIIITQLNFWWTDHLAECCHLFGAKPLQIIHKFRKIQSHTSTAGLTIRVPIPT